MDIITQYQSGQSIIEISKQYNCTVDKIRWLLKKNNVLELRKIGKYKFDENKIIEYYKNDISIKDISLKYSTSTSPIIKILKKHNVRKPNWLKTLPYSLSILVRDKKYFQELVDREITQKNIMKYLNCGQGMVVSLFKYHGIKNNNGIGRSLIKQKQSEISCTIENFKILYLKERLSLTDIAKKFAISVSYLRKIIKEKWKINDLLRKGHETRTSEIYNKYKNDVKFLQKKVDDNCTIVEIANQLDCCKDTIFKLLKKHKIDIPIKYRSMHEKEIADFVKRLLPKTDIHTNNKTEIYPYELDIFIPTLKIGIEYCGLYWHSDNNKEKNYHLNKLQRCEENEIQLLTIFEDEYIFNKILVENKIKSILLEFAF